MEILVQIFNTVSRYLLAIACAFAISVSAQNNFAQDDKKDEKAETKAKFGIGSKAPDIDIEHWLSDNDGVFEHITEFEEGKIYVIDFWMMRSPVSIGSMPQIAEIQSKFEDDDVQIISVTPDQPELIQQLLKVEVPEQDKDADPKKTFGDLTNTYCLASDPDGSVLKDYFLAAGKSQLPVCFIVGKTGLIEWIGSSLKMEEPLKAIVADDWDREAFKPKYIEAEKKAAVERKKMLSMQQKMQKGMTAVRDKMQDDDVDGAVKELERLIADKELAELPGAKGGFEVARMQIMVKHDHEDASEAYSKFVEDNKEDGQILNEVNWFIYELFEENGGDMDTTILKTAKKSAEYAIKSVPNNGALLDTLAHFIYIVDEDLDKAIEVQKKAVEHAGIQRDEIKPFLDELMKEKETGKKKKKKKKIESDF